MSQSFLFILVPFISKVLQKKVIKKGIVNNVLGLDGEPIPIQFLLISYSLPIDFLFNSVVFPIHFLFILAPFISKVFQK